jgi:alkyl hydroperoxide reductase subunit AhpC
LQLQEHEKEFKARNTKIVIITFELSYLARVYQEESEHEWPLLVDETREAYSAYDMLKASFWDVWGPSTWWAYLKEFARGRSLVESEGDVNQRGGDVLIDPNGIVRFHHVGDGPADRPSVSSILQVLDAGERE